MSRQMQRHAIIVITAAVLVTPAWPQPAAIDSLVPNPSAERAGDDGPAAWRFHSWRDARGWWADDHTHSGSHSLGIAGINGGWSTDVPVEAGSLYTLRLHYRAVNGRSRLLAFVRCPGDDGELRSLLYIPEVTIEHTQRGEFVGGEWTGGADERGWVDADLGDFRVPDGVREVSLLVKLTSERQDARLWIDDVVIRRVQEPRIRDTARIVGEFEGGVVWTDNENRKILPERDPPDGRPLRALRVRAAGGEYESFQLAVTPEREARDVTFDWGDLTGRGTIPAANVRCRRIETVMITEPLGPYGHEGLNPDPLTERLPVSIPAGVNQGFWFTLRVPQDQPAGNYRCEVALVIDGERVATVPLHLRVRRFSIPRRAGLDVHSHLRAAIALQRETGDEDEVLRRYYRDIYEHRSRCTPGVPVRVRVRGERAEVDVARRIEHMQFMRDELGARRFNVPSLWISHRGEHAMPPDASWEGIPIFAGDDLSRLNPDFVAPFTDYMRQMCAALKAGGVFLEPTVRFVDEMRLSEPRTYNAVRALSELLLSIEPELRIAHTVGEPEPRLFDVTHAWVLHTGGWERSLPEIEAARADGDAILVYNNAVNYPEHRPIRVRLWPWLLRTYEVDGTYSWWGTVCWRGDMEDPWTAGVGSSGVLLYPPRTPDEHGPIDSIRWELFREGLEDYEYMAMADDLARRCGEAGLAEAANTGRGAVDEALALVERWPSVRRANDQPYTLDVAAVDDARRALAIAIEQMQAALEQ